MTEQRKEEGEGRRGREGWEKWTLQRTGREDWCSFYTAAPGFD